MIFLTFRATHHHIQEWQKLQGCSIISKMKKIFGKSEKRQILKQVVYILLDIFFKKHLLIPYVQIKIH